MGTAEPKVAVITGASHGIGAGIVDAYRDLGWAVVANSLNMPASTDPEVLVVDGDVAEPATADRIADAALERFGHIDTLINNAGVFVSKPFTDYTAEDYEHVLGVNLTGFFYLTQRAIRAMLPKGSGHVVNISASVVYHAHSSEPSVLASLTKGGIAAATRSLAVEYATRGIRVNAVAPGVIKTPMHSADEYTAAAQLAPMERVGEVSDIVDGILYLESAPFVTGEILHVDGGQIAGR
ncbi:MAG TPA: SDR family oxidoreductase [Streptosporangiaceae bacterium]|nr:SDR family oxidoreductase [Streptosporangiaceae bacterium]